MGVTHPAAVLVTAEDMLFLFLDACWPQVLFPDGGTQGLPACQAA
jgi:hypothetical protein